MIEPARMTISRAFFIKLGTRGSWAEDSLCNNILRFGWSSIPLDWIHANQWERITERLRASSADKGAATRDINGLRELVASDGSDVWVTFHQSKLWWGQLADGQVEEDGVSKYRRLKAPWSDRALNGELLIANQIPGILSAVQGFRATLCSVRAPDVLERVLNGERSSAWIQVNEAKQALCDALEQAIRELHWKDFETLVDLVFRHAGWRRVSLLGETMKYADLELVEPITRDRYQVQIKSRADLKDVEDYAREFSSEGFRRLYFVVHSPLARLREHRGVIENVEAILPPVLAAMVADAGLTDWLLDRVR